MNFYTLQAWMHWYQDWYQVGFSPLRSRNENPRKPLYLQGLKLEAGVRIERLTLDFIRVLSVYTQQLVGYSSTIRPYPITALSIHIYWQFYWQCYSSRSSLTLPMMQASVRFQGIGVPRGDAT
jgi:hypothetical protein